MTLQYFYLLLFDIIKPIVISLEEINFQVLSIITDNNAINKKSYIIVLHSSKAFHRISTSFLSIRLSPYIKIH